MLLVSVVALAMILGNTGCASYMVYKESSRQVAMRKALITNNQSAIKALQLNGDVSSSGISVSFMEAIGERPWLQVGALGVDGLIAWGAYEGIKAIDESSGGDSEDGGNDANQNAAGENTVVVQGDGNNVNVNSGQPEEEVEWQQP